VRLLSLEIKGFKSFADKTIINFNDNMTGVVGPNGCGKSNVVDAIRWVLGEQKTSVLRSEKMENVIFNGTKHRKPSALAEVFLTFENNRNLLPTEYNTVTISRHYYRTGESEYRLNNVNCRLKDISNLFLDTGIGSDSYAIIELGMVNDILNNKDNSRRKLFEQAAGVSKYKSRKRETLNKLEATQNDLNRVDDLLFEIDANLKSLESQARKTERFHKLKDEYKEVSVEMALHTLKDVKGIFESLQTKQTEEQDRKIVLETEIITQDASLQSLKSDFIEKEKNLLHAQRELNELVSSLKDKENAKNLFTENVKNLNERIANWNKQNENASLNVSSLETSINAFNTQKEGEQISLVTLQSDLETAKLLVENIRLQHAETRRELDNEQVSLRTVENELVEIEKKISIIKVQKENLQREFELIEREIQNRNEEKNKLQSSLIELENKEQEQKRKIDTIGAQADAAQIKITSLETDIDTHRDELNKANRSLDARQNEYNLTKSFIDNMEGFPDSIKFLKNNSEWNTQAPLLSDIIAASPEYRIAIESFLEPYLNYYVVSDMNEAMRAINILSNAAKGRANFFVLNDFENENLNTENNSNATKAIDVIDCENSYRKLVNYLLNNVYVIDEDKRPEQKGIYIAKTGKFIRTPFSFSGGQVGAISGKRLGRVKNLENLSKEIEQLKNDSTNWRNKLTTLQTELTELKNNNIDRELDALRDNHNLTRNHITSLKTKLENIEQFFISSDDKRKSINERNISLDSDIVILNAQQEQKLSVKNLQAEKISNAQSQFSIVDNQLTENSQSFNQKNIQFLQQQNKINTITQEINFKRLQLDESLKTIENNKIEIENANRNLIDIDAKLKEVETELIFFYENKSRQEEYVNEADRQFYESRGKINSIEEQIKALSKNKEQCDFILNETREKVNDLKLQLSSLKERLDLEFKISIDDLMNQEADPNFNLDELKEKVIKMKSRLDNYGEINPFAVEAFNDMKTRAEFIHSQKEDLANAKTSLLTTIDEIESKAKEQFMDAFNKVKENFILTFRSLFTKDDDCDLILSNPENPLEAEIDIIAKPKGKRPQTINQLSGGEKTLTAISLLFALYLLKPAPFCILDEVDAPLDDSNVDKFTNIIREFSDKSQFILVTHNKQTMASVDVIYGVTMQEEGVSKVVPVDFRQLEAAEAV
jgi:chromosome segregation protein